MADDAPQYTPPGYDDAYPAVYSHVTHSRFGEHFPEGERMVVMFHDRAVIAKVTDVVNHMHYRCQSCGAETVEEGQHDQPECEDCGTPMARVDV